MRSMMGGRSKKLIKLGLLAGLIEQEGKREGEPHPVAEKILAHNSAKRKKNMLFTGRDDYE